MLRLLAILSVITPFSLGYQCNYYGYQYSTGYSNIIYSPNYPETYPYGINCDWEIYIPSATSIILECEFFNLRDCQRDYLEISKDGRSFENSDVYCGTGTLRYTVYSNIFKAHLGTQYRSPKSSNNLMRYDYNSDGFKCQIFYTEEPIQNCECGIKNSGGTGGRIVGGNEATINEYPWLCMLRDKNGEHYCGCSLINNKYVLTASHCVVDGGTGEVTKPEDIIVSLGDHQPNTEAETDKTVHIGVRSVISHENYNVETDDNDIAILELAQPIQFNEAISPVCLPFSKKDTDMSGLQGTITGWGATSPFGEDSETLLEVDLPILTTKECEAYLGNYLTDNMMCTYEEGKDACQGDSGGPLISDMLNNGVFYQVGVVSWGVGCGSKDFPGVYTKVENYLDWIVSKTDGNFCRK